MGCGPGKYHDVDPRDDIELEPLSPRAQQSRSLPQPWDKSFSVQSSPSHAAMISGSESWKGSPMSTQSSYKSSLPVRLNTYRSDIDGLRAVAVIAVVIYHLDPAWLPAGLVGVDIFFIISGFVVTSSLRDRVEEASFYGFACEFFARRAKRLLPLSLLVISCAALALALVAPHWDPRAERFLLVGLSGTFANANNWLVYERDDYMDLLSKDVHAYNPFLHLWSLGVEEQFYIIAPILLYGNMKLLAEGKRADPSMFILLSAASIVFCWWADQVQHSPSYAYYLLSSRFWELAGGVLLCLFCAGREALIADLLKHQPMVLLLLQLWTLLLLGVALCVKFDEDAFPLPGAIMPVAGTMGYILSGWSPYSPLNFFLRLKPLVYLGKISYSIYLWHVPVAAICRWFILGSDLSVQAKLLCLLCTAALAVLSHHLVEAPIRKWECSSKTVLCSSLLAIIVTAMFVTSLLYIRHVVVSSNCFLWLTLAALIFLLVLFGVHFAQGGGSVQLLYVFFLFVVVFGLTYNVYHDNAHLQHRSEVRVNPQVKVNPPPILAPQTSCSLCTCASDVSTYHAPPESCLADQCKCDMEPPSCFEGTPLSDADFQPAVRWGRENCLGAHMTEEEILSRCLAPAHEASRRAIWLIGDSHSFALVPCLTPSATDAGFDVFNYSWPAHHACHLDWSKVITVLDKVVKPDDVVAFAACFYCMQWCLAHYEELITRLASFTRAKTARFLVFRDVPLLQDESLNCANSDPWQQSQCAIPTTEALTDVHDTRKMLSAYASSYDMIDLFTPMCANGICDIWVPGTSAVAYVDEHHLNLNGCHYLAPFICAGMRKLGLYP